MEPVKIFLDTNLVIDFYTGRMGDGLANKIMLIGKDPHYELCISILTAINVLYIAKKYLPELTPSDLSNTFTLFSQDLVQWKDAQELGVEDFEDAVQISCALHNNSLIAISRDKHFNVAPMISFTPEEFVKAVTE